MKIAFLVPDFPRLSETFIVSQLEQLVERGHDVVVYARRPPPEAIEPGAAARHALRIREQPVLDEARLSRTLRGLALLARHGWRHPRLVARAVDPTRFGRHALSFAALRAAVPALDRPRFDVVHCHFGPAGVMGAMLQEMGAIEGPLVVTFYGHDVTRYPQQHGPDVYRRLFDRAELVLALDPVMQSRLEALGARPETLDVHPISVDCERFAPPNAAPDRSSLRLLSVGRLVEKKGFADGLRAVARATAAGCHVHYVIAGDGPLAPDLRRLADELSLQDTVEFVGSASHEDVRRLMASSHALLAPSVRADDGDEEGTPLVIIEAMACGLPVVTTRHSGIPSLVEDSVTGWLADEHDHETLADRIGRLDDHDLAARLGDAARATALERFEVGRLTDRMVARYQRLVDRSERP